MSLVGKTVLYVLNEGPNVGHARPAVVVREWVGLTPPLVNLQVITDSNSEGTSNDRLPPIMWRTSIRYDPNGAPFTYHFIEDNANVETND